MYQIIRQNMVVYLHRSGPEFERYPVRMWASASRILTEDVRATLDPIQASSGMLCLMGHDHSCMQCVTNDLHSFVSCSVSADSTMLWVCEVSCGKLMDYM